MLLRRRFADPGGGYRLKALVLAAALPLLTSCISVTIEPRVLAGRPGGVVEVTTLDCGVADPPLSHDAGADALDSRSIRVLTWNIHKQNDIGWEHDLTRFAAAADLALLQEVDLQDRLRQVIEGAQLQWTMASSFVFVDEDVGVMTASRVAPLRSCMQRTTEPLIRIPKSVVIAWFRLAGVSQTLAVANIHAINFSLSLDSYRAQLDAIEKTLAGHRGPIIFAGDLNTWSEGRMQAVREMTGRLRLLPINLRDDKRALFFGKPFDYVFIRGLEMVDASAIPVTSSDHNPVVVTLRVAGP